VSELLSFPKCLHGAKLVGGKTTKKRQSFVPEAESSSRDLIRNIGSHHTSVPKLVDKGSFR
jgi:hypothetical protein